MNKNKIHSFVIEMTWLPTMPHGWGNGYAIVGMNHPSFGLDYDDVDVVIHGGLTYGRSAKNMAGLHKKLLPKEVLKTPKKYWIFGFDTAHYEDTMENWSKKAVVEEAENLAEQLNTIKK